MRVTGIHRVRRGTRIVGPSAENAGINKATEKCVPAVQRWWLSWLRGS